MSEIATRYRRWLGEVWQGDLDVLPLLCAERFVGHWPDRDVHGLAEAAEQIGRTFALFENVSTTIDVGPLVDGGHRGRALDVHRRHTRRLRPGAPERIGKRPSGSAEAARPGFGIRRPGAGAVAVRGRRGGRARTVKFGKDLPECGKETSAERKPPVRIASAVGDQRVPPLTAAGVTPG